MQLALLRVAIKRGQGERHRAQRLVLCAQGRPLRHGRGEEQARVLGHGGRGGQPTHRVSCEAERLARLLGLERRAPRRHDQPRGNLHRERLHGRRERVRPRREQHRRCQRGRAEQTGGGSRPGLLLRALGLAVALAAASSSLLPRGSLEQPRDRAAAAALHLRAARVERHDSQDGLGRVALEEVCCEERQARKPPQAREGLLGEPLVVPVTAQCRAHHLRHTVLLQVICVPRARAP